MFLQEMIIKIFLYKVYSIAKKRNGNLTFCHTIQSCGSSGELNLNCIEEIWNSPKAHSLFYLNQSDISKDSPCSICKDFKDCHSYKHVCWRDIILAYGSNNWDFPDPFCPLAPPILKDISME